MTIRMSRDYYTVNPCYIGWYTDGGKRKREPEEHARLTEERRLAFKQLHDAGLYAKTQSRMTEKEANRLADQLRARFPGIALEVNKTCAMSF